MIKSAMQPPKFIQIIPHLWANNSVIFFKALDPFFL